MFGEDPLKPGPKITDSDVHELRAQVVALQEIVRALISAMPDPTEARAVIRDRLETELSMGLNPEHWRGNEHAAVTETFDYVVDAGAPKFTDPPLKDSPAKAAEPPDLH